MSAMDMVLRMWPMWVLGLFVMLTAVMSGNKDLLKVDFKTVGKWSIFLVIISVLRLVLFYFTWDMFENQFSAVRDLPLETIPAVFWEDAAFTLPILLIGRLMGNGIKSRIFQIFSLVILALAFGSGHVYQGIGAVVLLTLYIPYTLNIAKTKGLGTIMICHVLYDLCTLGLIKVMLGYM